MRRGAAIGVAIGLAAAAETVRSTPALRADPVSALELSAVLVAIYAAAGLALVPALGALGRGARLAGPRLLWPLAGLAIAFAAWNELARTVDALSPWRHVGRAVGHAVRMGASEGARRDRVPIGTHVTCVKAAIVLALLATAACRGDQPPAAEGDVAALNAEVAKEARRRAGKPYCFVFNKKNYGQTPKRGIRTPLRSSAIPLRSSAFKVS